MKVLPFTLLFFTIGYFAAAQKKIVRTTRQSYNLVSNGSFEDINVCTEFDAHCEPEGWFFLPTYTVEPQGNDSNKYEVIAFCNQFYKGRSGNYLYTKLLCPLKEGNRYQFSIWIVTPQNEFEHFDIYFSTLEPSTHLALNTITDPAFSLTSQHAESSRRLWKKYSYTYTATGEEHFITLGNFSDKLIDQEKATANNKQGDILYGIDNISLSPLDSREPLCNEYFAGIQQLYDQNYRHPPRMTHRLPIDSTLLLSKNKGIVPLSLSKAKPFTQTDTLIIPDILFRSNSSKINAGFETKLESLITHIRIRHLTAIEIIGHTDNTGDPGSNIKLSLQRAGAIRKYILLKLPLLEPVTSIKGEGETRPTATNETVEGRKINRRVEILLKQ